MSSCEKAGHVLKVYQSDRSAKQPTATSQSELLSKKVSGGILQRFTETKLKTVGDD